MISKVIKGSNMHSLVRYLTGPGRANEHSNQHLVAASGTLEETLGQALRDAAAHAFDAGVGVTAEGPASAAPPVPAVSGEEPHAAAPARASTARRAGKGKRRIGNFTAGS